MKILRAVSVLFGAAILVLGASARQASAGGIHRWGSAGYCGPGDCGYGGFGAWGYGGGYGGCGTGGCGLSTAGDSAVGYGGDYARYVVGHGPMFPAGDSPHAAYSYGVPVAPAPDTSAGPNRR
jgi:hypothetical protein